VARPGGSPKAQALETSAPAPTDPGEPVQQDIAAITLAAVRRAASGSGVGHRSHRFPGRSGRLGPVLSGAGADERDPQSVSAGVADLVQAHGWEARSRVAAVIGRWPDIAGEQMAQHVSPVRYDEEAGLLVLQADSTAWATQTRLLSSQLVRRLDELAGAGLVRQIEVGGPRAPRPAYGKLRVAGRGPRDTYG